MDAALWVGVGAAAVAVVALIACGLLWMGLRRTRAAQQVLLPDGASAGLVDRQATLQRAMTRLEEGLRDLESLVERQGEVTEASLRTALRFQGMVRYDAYRDMGGSQSWSIALLDGDRNGAVITCLHARDHARVYFKEMTAGTPGQRLSPEEERALALAAGEPPRGPRETGSPAPTPEPDPAPETVAAAPDGGAGAAAGGGDADTGEIRLDREPPAGGPAA
jgi:hypothetical protein